MRIDSVVDHDTDINIHVDSNIYFITFTINYEDGGIILVVDMIIFNKLRSK